MKVSTWYTSHVCRACDTPLSWKEVMYSFGACPECGAVSSGTIVDCKQIAIRKVWNHPRWMFWKKPEIEVKEK